MRNFYHKKQNALFSRVLFYSYPFMDAQFQIAFCAQSVTARLVGHSRAVCGVCGECDLFGTLNSNCEFLKTFPCNQVIMDSKAVKLLLLLVICLWCTESSPFPQGQQVFSLEELVPPRDFYRDQLTVQWISDTEFIHREPGVGILKFNALSHSLTTVLSEMELYNLHNKMVSSFSKDGKYVLLSSNRKKIYRYSSIAQYTVLDLVDKTLHIVAEKPLQVIVWSNNSCLAYVMDNNVFYVPNVVQPQELVQLTTEGVPGEVYFGATDWIYEEEVFNAAEALWFSPSGAYLAVASFNDTNVESVVYPYYGNATDLNNQYPELVEFKYPKAGRVNPQVGLRVFKLNDTGSEPWIIPTPVEIVGNDHILGRVNWVSDQNLIVLWLNRRQSISVLIDCDLNQEKCSKIEEHKEPDGWIDIQQPFFDRAGKKMVEIQPLHHEEKRFQHVARYDLVSHTTEDLSPGNSTVTKILGWDQDTNTIYFIVSPGNSPWQRQLWSSTDGVLRCLSCKESSCHYTTALFSPGASFGIVTCAAASVVPKIFLYYCKTDKFEILKDNARLAVKLSHYKLPITLFNVISLENDLTAHVRLLLPPDIKQNKQYPMVVNVYAGPGSTKVVDNFEIDYNLYLTSNRSYIVAAIDVRGSGCMGVEAMHAVNNALGTVEITDTLTAIRQLVSLYSFIDPKRVGVSGISYGGYTTTMMLIRDDQKTLACGAAVAPVTSWLYYDSIYTERYMGTPLANPVGYEQSDATVAAEALRGRTFLLIHGTGDDNVHYQHSMVLAKELQHADIDFEQVSYTDEDHSLRGVWRHYYHTLDHFWAKCFS